MLDVICAVVVWLIFLYFFYYAIGPFWLVAGIVIIVLGKLDKLFNISDNDNFIGNFFFWGIRIIGPLVVAVGAVYKFFNH